jgi:hypothetical protein
LPPNAYSYPQLTNRALRTWAFFVSGASADKRVAGGEHAPRRGSNRSVSLDGEVLNPLAVEN